MRLIDADALLEKLRSERNPMGGEDLIDYCGIIRSAPTIESPRPDWTPCAEGMPEKVDKRLWSRDVLATIKQKTGNCFVVVAYYHYGHEQWKTDDMTVNDAIDVLAWQPLPAPYNPDRKEDADHIVEANKKIEED